MPHKTDEPLWKKKAMAFAVRSHRHLWGKNNEDPLAFLFKQGLNNDFIKERYLGWNKFGQERPCENWGLSREPGSSETFFLPAGIVLPVIEDKNLVSIFIQIYKEFEPVKLFRVPGSLTDTWLLADKPQSTVIIIDDLMDGLFLFQEKRSCLNVLIRPNDNSCLDKKTLKTIDQAETLLFLTRTEMDPGAFEFNNTLISPVYYDSRAELFSIAAGR